MFLKEKALILIVDDTETNIDILVDALTDEYELAVALCGKDALETVDIEKPDLILLDIMMPEMSGYEVCKILKSNPDTTEIPIIFLTALTQLESKTKSFELGAVDYITKPFEILEVRARVKTHLELKKAHEFLMNQNQVLEEMVRKRTDELEKSRAATIFSLAALAETRDPETGQHIKRTQYYVRVLAESLRKKEHYKKILTPQYIELLFASAPLHDIGKVGVPDAILLKPAGLSNDEFKEMKKHTLYGKNTLNVAIRELGNDSFFGLALEIAFTHHEYWDGTGYPNGLKGLEIPLSGRIMALADVYDALVNERIYKEAFSIETAREMIVKRSGIQFDPDVVDAFLENEEEFIRIFKECQDLKK